MGPYMAEDIRDRLRQFSDRGQILRGLVDHQLEAITAQTISQAAEQGDELACEVLNTAGWALGVSIGNTANLINPQRFVLGGGVTKSGAQFWETVRRVSQETALPEVHFEIVPAALGDEAPLWGAIALASEAVAFC
jgi:glucokinase